MLILGHRGAAGYEVENTVSSVRRAIEMRLDYIEIDVQRTKDDVLVVFHDDLLDRVTNASGYIWDHTFEQLESDVVVGGTEKIPSLARVCAVVSDAGAKLFVELKAIGIERAALSLVMEHLPASRFMIGSFHHEAVLSVKDIAGAVKTVALLAGSPLNAGRIVRESRCDYLGLAVDTINPRVIGEAKDAGAGVLVWTVDDVRDLERLKRLGVDGVFSNVPDRMKAAM